MGGFSWGVRMGWGLINDRRRGRISEDEEGLECRSAVEQV